MRIIIQFIAMTGIILGLAANGHAQDKPSAKGDRGKAAPLVKDTLKPVISAKKDRPTTEQKKRVSKAPKEGIYHIKQAKKTVGKAKYKRALGFAGIPKDIRGPFTLEHSETGTTIDMEEGLEGGCDPACDANQYCLRRQCIDET